MKSQTLNFTNSNPQPNRAHALQVKTAQALAPDEKAHSCDALMISKRLVSMILELQQGTPPRNTFPQKGFTFCFVAGLSPKP